MNYSNHKRSYIFKNNKRHLRADGLLLLLSALRPRLLAPVVAVAALAVSSGWLFPTSVSAVSLTLTIPEAITLDIMPNAEGAFKKSESKQISIKTDAFAGYTLSIKAKSGSDLVNGKNKISPIASETTEEEFSASSVNNTWGFLPSKFNSAENTKFRPAPTTENSVIDKTNAKNDENNNYDLTIAAKVDSTLPTGEYTNTFVISAAANTVSYSIQYELNDGTGGPEQNPQTGNTAEQTVKLSDKKPTKNNSEFMGWCDVSTKDEKCSGNTREAGGDLPLTNGDNNIKLYAMWKSKYGENTMQGWTGCSSLAQHSTVTLTDARDNNTYTVAKLKDGKCWMTQNLRIVNKTLHSIDSDVDTDAFTVPSSNINSFSNTNPYANSVYIGSTTGGYYSWFCSVAGTGTLTQKAPNSICPRNWSLPTKNDAESLLNQYNYTTIQQNPANFNMDSYLWSGNTLHTTHTMWWTSEPNGSGSAYDIWAYHPNSTLIVSGDSFAAGMHVRCVAKN